jgi:hypothetical protein
MIQLQLELVPFGLSSLGRCGSHVLEIQEELLWICEAAHVPVIWATQVVQNFIKKGVPK